MKELKFKYAIYKRTSDGIEWWCGVENRKGYWSKKIALRKLYEYKSAIALKSKLQRISRDTNEIGILVQNDWFAW